MPDKFPVRRLVVVGLGEAHAPLGLFADGATRVFTILAEEVGDMDAPLLQRPQHLPLILADEAVEQHLAVLLFCDREVRRISVFVSRAERYVVAVALLFYTLQVVQ